MTIGRSLAGGVGGAGVGGAGLGGSGEVEDAEAARVDAAELEAQPHIGGHREVVVTGAYDVHRGEVGLVVGTAQEVGGLCDDTLVGAVELRNGDDGELVAGAFDVRLIVLCDLRHASMRQQVGIDVGVGK